MPHIKHIPINALIAVDQFANVLCGGWPDETLSSRAWRLRATSRGWALARCIIDGLFFWQVGHCESAYQSEVQRNHLPPQQRTEGTQSGEAVAVSGGVKYDSGKLRLDLVTPEMVRGLGNPLTYGAGKYGDRNWEQGLAPERLYAAAERHLLAWRSGETIDPESGLPHLEHAFCSLGMLVTLGARENNG